MVNSWIGQGHTSSDRESDHQLSLEQAELSAVTRADVAQRGAAQQAPPPTTSILSWDRLSCTYARNASPVIQEVSGTLRPRELMAVMGSSGAGKSLAGGLVPVLGRQGRAEEAGQ